MAFYKKALINSSVLLISTLLFLTFFSNTIYTFNLPSVTLDYPSNGVIINAATAEGVVEFAESEYYYAGGSGRITLLVRTGDSVLTGSPLYNIEADTEDLKESLEGAMREIDNIELNIAKAQSDIDYTLGLLTKLEVGEVKVIESIEAEILECEQEIERLNIELEQKNTELQKLEILFAAGAIPKVDLTEAQYSLELTENQINRLVEKKQNAVLLQNKSINAEKRLAAKTYEEESQALNKTLSDLDFQLREWRLQLKTQTETIERIKDQLEKAGQNQSIFADKNGIITKISAGLEESDHVAENDLILKLGISDSSFQTVVSFSDSVNYLNVNDNVTININTRQQYNLPGTVAQTFFEDGMLKARINFAATENISEGEVAELHIEDVSDLYKNILPNTAIHKDGAGYYILYAEKVRGMFGYEYYTRRMAIHVLLQDINNTACTIISDEPLPVIINSDKTVSENDKIRIVGGSDLVEIR